MGGNVFTESDYSRSLGRHVRDSSSVTKQAEKEAMTTGKLNPQVDPAEFGVIRQSKPRFVLHESDIWELEFGIPMPVETRLDTTGSMGDNVDRAMKALPQQYGLCSTMLPEFVLQLSTGIFGDCEDKFVLCRPKFAYSADRLVERLTLMAPERAGHGNGGEDPQYGLFGAAYLTSAYINKIGLKRYDFTISDEPGRDRLYENQLIRIFGKEVFNRTAENGYVIEANDIPSTHQIVNELLKQAHAFFIEIPGWGHETHYFWTKIYGHDRVIILKNIDWLPHVQAIIIGLTEGSLTLGSAAKFLIEHGTGKKAADEIVRSVAHIPIGAQAELRSNMTRPLPKKGDLFREKNDPWPIGNSELESLRERLSIENESASKIEWL